MSSHPRDRRHSRDKAQQMLYRPKDGLRMDDEVAEGDTDGEAGDHLHRGADFDLKGAVPRRRISLATDR